MSDVAAAPAPAAVPAAALAATVYPARFVTIVAGILKDEGGYSAAPNDPGGATNHGITIGLAKAIGIDVNGDHVTDILDIKALTEADATKVYYTYFWVPLHCDEMPAGGPGDRRHSLKDICGVAEVDDQ